jgi:hypothetical protein
VTVEGTKLLLAPTELSGDFTYSYFDLDSTYTQSISVSLNCIDYILPLALTNIEVHIGESLEYSLPEPSYTEAYLNNPLLNQLCGQITVEIS